MAEERSEEARLSGLLQVTLGGVVVELPVLRIRQARGWKQRLAEARFEGDPSDEAAVMSYASDAMVDLVAAYDVTGILGGREALEDRASDLELYDAFRAMLDATFPFVGSRVLTQDFGRLLMAAFYGRAGSTNGHSPAGDSTPMPSSDDSRTSSSSSSGTLARSAS